MHLDCALYICKAAYIRRIATSRALLPLKSLMVLLDLIPVASPHSENAQYCMQKKMNLQLIRCLVPPVPHGRAS